MRIQMEPIEYFAEIDGVACRIWNGVTEDHTPCIVLVHRIAVDNPHDSAEFSRLCEQPQPKAMAVSR